MHVLHGLMLSLLVYAFIVSIRSNSTIPLLVLNLTTSLIFNCNFKVPHLYQPRLNGLPLSRNNSIAIAITLAKKVTVVILMFPMISNSYLHQGMMTKRSTHAFKGCISNLWVVKVPCRPTGPSGGVDHLTCMQLKGLGGIHFQTDPDRG